MMEASELNGWEPVGERYQKTAENINGQYIWIMLWYNSKYAKWFTGEVHGNSYANVKSFHSLELALQT